MREVDFLIFFESYEREYENTLLLKWELERRGRSVAICNTIHNDYWRSLFFRPRVVAVHTLRNNRNVHAYTNYLGYRPNKLVDLQYEQVLGRSYRNSDTWIPTGKARNAARVCWGNDAFRRLTQGDIDEGLLKLTGAMQMDTLRPEFNSYYLSKDALGKTFDIDASKTWVLFNAGFTALTADEATLRKIAKRVGNVGHYVSIRAKVQTEILSWMDAALDSDESLVFIYRPHPGEKPTSAVSAMCEKHSRFVWNGELSVKQWISAADIVSVWNSTSVVESYYAQRPTMVLRPVNCSENNEVPLFDRASFVDDYLSFIGRIRELMVGDSRFPIPDEDVESYYGSRSEKPSFVKVCDFLEEVLCSERYLADFTLPFSLEYLRYEARFIALTAYASLFRKTGLKFSKAIPVKRRELACMEQNALRYSPEALRKTYEQPLRAAYEVALKEIARP